jgi:predicted enzyme related to lactoylglutathione lyase
MTKPYVSHVEWCCRDIEKAADFFQALFAWQFKPFGNNYLLCKPVQGPAIGLLRSERTSPGANPIDRCLVFVTVTSINDCLQRATALGGSVFVEKIAIPDYGWYAQLKDVEGNIVGLFESLN